MAAATLTFPSQTLLKNVVDPVDGTDAATKEYVDGRTGAGSVAAAGSNTQIQFNSADSIGASANLTFDYSSNVLTIGGNLVSTNANLGNLATANYINVTNNLKVSGDANIVGNLTVLGTVSYIETSTTYVTDPLYEIGGGSQGAVLSTDDNKDRGTILHYFDTTPIDAFIGWDNSNNEFAIASDVSVTDNVVSYNAFGNIRVGNILAGNLVNANYFTGDGGLLSNIKAAGGAANTVSASAQPNITSLGNLLNLQIGNLTSSTTGSNGIVYFDGNGDANLSGNIIAAGNVTVGTGTGGSITGANSVTANFFIGDAGYLSNVQSANIIGIVANANYASYAGNVVNASQSNITSVGTLTSLTVSGDVSAQSNLTVSDSLTTSNLTVTGESILQGNIEAQSNITITGDRDSTNSSTGALIITLGGLGVHGNINSGMGVSGVTLTGNITTANQSNITQVGTLTSLVVGNLTANTTFGNGTITLTNAGNISGGNLVSATYLTGTLTTSAQPNITSVGTLTNTTMGSSNSLSGGNLVSATYLTGTLTTSAQPNITSVGTLNDLISGGNVNFTSASNVSLGTVANIHIAGGTSGQYLKTDGSGIRSWSTVDTSKIANGTSEIDVLNNGNINFTIAGQTNAIVFSSDSNISGANVVSANTVSASNAITRNGRTVATYVSSTTMPTNPQVGDEWYDQTLHKIYQYIYDGSAYTWIDVSAGYIVANVQAQAGTLVVRDNNGNIYGNTLSANVLTADALNVTSTVSKGSGVSVSNSTDTLIDRFPKTLYRSAKYTISARNDDGFEVAEILMIHDDTMSFIQTYGDVSTGIVQDIVTFSSNIVAGNVCLYATGSNSNTYVNLVSTYVTD